jgi:hypothetical protein
MAKYRVRFKGIIWINLEIESESKEEAIEIAEEKAHVNSYCGNGGCDKLVGVSQIENGEISIEADDYLEMLKDKIECL